jgi:hypothetical protein
MSSAQGFSVRMSFVTCGVSYELYRGILMRLSASITAVFICCLFVPAWSNEAPRVVEKNGRQTLFVEGHPFLILGGQIHNSSAWPSELPQVWKSMAALNANTVEAPVYWEQLEGVPGHFDFTNVDQLIEGARAHGLHVILLWFGTWKNGNMHYVPAWVKSDSRRYPRVLRADGEPIDVLSPLSRNTLDADKAAFTALMRHVSQIDGEQHTVLMVQVENESGNIGSVRDFSPEANREFAGLVPADLLSIVHKQPGTWNQVFGSDADEVFQLYHQAKYINEIAAAGKREFAIPYYINVWVSYPPPELPQRQIPMPGIQYPSGGPVQKFVTIWKQLATAIDIIGPDIYSDNSGFYKELIDTYHRPDNPLWIPETGRSDSFAKLLYYALGKDAIGFSPFGVDESGWNITGDSPWKAHANNFALLGPMSREIAQWEFDGTLKTSIEEPGQAQQQLDFGNWQVDIAFGFPQSDGRKAPGTHDAHGAALVVQLGPDEFLITGVDAGITFHLPGKQPWMRSEIVSAEEGHYEQGVWKSLRMLNGDETDRGLCFYQKPEIVRVRLGRF